MDEHIIDIDQIEDGQVVLVVPSLRLMVMVAHLRRRERGPDRRSGGAVCRLRRATTRRGHRCQESNPRRRYQVQIGRAPRQELQGRWPRRRWRGRDDAGVAPHGCTSVDGDRNDTSHAWSPATDCAVLQLPARVSSRARRCSTSQRADSPAPWTTPAGMSPPVSCSAPVERSTDPREREPSSRRVKP